MSVTGGRELLNDGVLFSGPIDEWREGAWTKYNMMR